MEGNLITRYTMKQWSSTILSQLLQGQTLHGVMEFVKGTIAVVDLMVQKMLEEQLSLEPEVALSNAANANKKLFNESQWICASSAY